MSSTIFEQEEKCPGHRAMEGLHSDGNHGDGGGGISSENTDGDSSSSTDDLPDSNIGASGGERLAMYFCCSIDSSTYREICCGIHPEFSKTSRPRQGGHVLGLVLSRLTAIRTSGGPIALQGSPNVCFNFATCTHRRDIIRYVAPITYYRVYLYLEVQRYSCAWPTLCRGNPGNPP